MKNRNLQSKNLDRIGRELLEAARISNDEIEQIVASPHLFDSVKARIKTEQRERPTESVSGSRRHLFVWNWQRTSAAFAVSALFVFGLYGFFVMNKVSPNEEQIAKTPQISLENAPAKVLQQPESRENAPEVAQKEKSPVKPFFRQAALKKEKVKTQNTVRKNNSPKKPDTVESDPVREFYALNYIGSPNETGEALRVVRAELSRSELFAMGVNLPIENEPEKVKTDLLVGTDGVARAIRIVE